MTLYNQTAERLVVLACSATKLDHAAPAIELYRGGGCTHDQKSSQMRSPSHYHRHIFLLRFMPSQLLVKRMPIYCETSDHFS